MKQALIFITLLFLLIISVYYTGSAQKTGVDNTITSNSNKAASDSPRSVESLHMGVHNAGNIFMPISYGDFGKFNRLSRPTDWETEDTVWYGAYYPKGSSDSYLYYGDLWVGGIVGEDTLVSQGTLWARWLMYTMMAKEFWPDKITTGGIHRTGRFADDEFTAVYTDTLAIDSLVGEVRPAADSSHVPLGIQITQTSYSWADSVYSNFIIVTYTVENIGPDYIHDGWIGFYMEAFVEDSLLDDPYGNDPDDFCGMLDTFLYDNNPASRVLIPYVYDNDGDPIDHAEWASSSIRGVFSIRLLDTSVEDPVHNYNWWTYVYSGFGEYGPRQLGTEEDPFREFTNGRLGEPYMDVDKYYVLSHPEIDFNQIEMAVHDSSDGWIPCTDSDPGNYSDFLYSFGSFDLSPGDSVTFALAIVGADNIHVNPDDYANFFDPESPFDFQDRLDFSEMMIQHRRADSVYHSGFTLPQPGPPAGLRVIDYDDDSVALVWNRSFHPSVAGYHLNVKDTVYNNHWYQAFPQPIGDTSCAFPVTNSNHTHFFTVSLVDTAGWVSAPSLEIAMLPSLPHIPQNLTVMLDSLVPSLQWQPVNDSGLVAYLIYRAVWKEPFTAYDSTAQIWYRDEAAESGVKYSYRITARSENGEESSPTDSVSTLPMVMDREVLFYDMNYDNIPGLDPYHSRYVDRLVHSLQPQTDLDYFDIEDGRVMFKTMSRYSVIVFDSEMRGGKFVADDLDSIGLYLSHGGKALFIVPNASSNDLYVINTRLSRYGGGNFFQEFICLDSAVTNGIVFFEGRLCGDLIGCLPESPDYPVLEADSIKLAAAPIAVDGFIPLSGYIYPREGVDILYRYQSMYPDSTFHNQINGIAYSDSLFKMVFFNIPLSLMEGPANIEAFRAALTYLDVDLTCGDLNADDRLDVGDAVLLINYLYRDGPPPSDMHRADVNCDGGEDVGDALEIINAIFRNGPGLRCCPR